MIIRKINLLNFRNYSKCNITLNNKMNIFVGLNDAGKSNIPKQRRRTKFN